VPILTPLAYTTGFEKKDQIDLEVLFVYLLYRCSQMDASLLTSFQHGNIHVCVICCKVCYFAAQAYKITDLTSKKGTEWNMHCAPADWFCTGWNLFAECI
jgi:hypothetical protein